MGALNDDSDASKHNWAPIFSIKEFVTSNPGIKTETFALDKPRLELLAIQVTQLRKRIEDRAKALLMLESAVDSNPKASKNSALDNQVTSKYEVSQLAKKIRSREKYMSRYTGPISNVDYPEPVAPGLRYAVRKRKDLSEAEIADIVHKVVVGHHLQADVAKEHRLKPVLVSRLTIKAKNNPRYIHEILLKRDEKKQHRLAIAEAVSEMNKYDVVIDSAAGV